ncbi:ABC transporter substrate-binding protein [Nonomuraea muscovyensis]|uniref:ABC-type branched-subunit amino acid transport system substrate-binding protein n=1 Tax=Nonomuraea muscovyensis TaxID=1124761 RepID=A0A7X0C7M3_9ACTN|nr:ABC transporter substrate-binding protein [Nonomuraea muscovyensis]MBB6349111.1 ABC-type branched-subunit amino acid transport system substrate-binding protein [Nonomuraea muscovyensis]MDF2705965.1 branched-chain amino acid transporter substrate-binding protein [Nonomuraea muscovyensis]
MKSRYVVVSAALVALLSACGVIRGDDEGSKGAQAAGVTSEPCPAAVDKNKGCIYLGTVSDLTAGPFAALAVPITDAQKAFWARVNKAGGIGGTYEVDVTKFVRDNKYNPEVHRQVYNEMKDQVLGLAQTLGSPTTAAILGDLKANSVVAAPASWTSAWEFEDVILETGANYCVEAMNSVDYAMETYKPKSVMAVHLAGDYGADAAAGAKIAAERNGLTFTSVETPSGATEQGRAITEITKNKPDLVILTTGPADAATIVGQAAAAGFKGRFIGTGPTWNPALLKSPAAPALKALYEQSAPGKPWDSDTPGHQAMREALPGVTPNDGYTSGWAWAYPMKAALEKMVASGDVSRKGLLAAVKSLQTVDYEGMLPPEAGNFAGDPNAATFRQTLVNKLDDKAPTGVTTVKDFFVGPTAQGHTFDGPCYAKL